MNNGNGPAHAPDFDLAGFARTLGTWLGDHEDLLRGVAALRELGDQAFTAVTAVLVVPEIRKLRLGWELWEAMAEGQGLDPEVLLLEATPLGLIELGHEALYGEGLFDNPQMGLP